MIVVQEKTEEENKEQLQEGNVMATEQLDRGVAQI